SNYRGGNGCRPVHGWAGGGGLEPRRLAKSRVHPRYLRFRNVSVSAPHELAIDSQGGVLPPPLLREYAGIASDVMVTGDVDKFRIWDRQVWHRAFGEHEGRL